jgi:hypothetical protein
MLQINFLKNSWYFKEFHLQANEVLFDEGETDNNLYIVVAWKINVEKYTTNKRGETKILASLWKNEIFWEAALNSDKPKGVKMKAQRETLLLSINATKGLVDFSEKYPEEWLNLLKYIIHISNTRLLKSNELITANYKVTQEILKIEEINNKNIFWLIDKLEEIINIDYTLFLENNPVLENYLVIKYDSRDKWKMKDKIIEIADNKLDLLELKLNDMYHNIQQLTIWDIELWYLVYFRKNVYFSDNDKKILTSISIWISWLIKEKKILEEEQNKKYMES